MSVCPLRRTLLPPTLYSNLNTRVFDVLLTPIVFDSLRWEGISNVCLVSGWLWTKTWRPEIFTLSYLKTVKFSGTHTMKRHRQDSLIMFVDDTCSVVLITSPLSPLFLFLRRNSYDYPISHVVLIIFVLIFVHNKQPSQNSLNYNDIFIFHIFIFIFYFLTHLSTHHLSNKNFSQTLIGTTILNT